MEDGSHAVDSFARGRSEAMAWCWWCAASLHGWLLFAVCVLDLEVGALFCRKSVRQIEICAYLLQDYECA